MRVLIVGGGIGGLSLAIYLRQKGIRPVIVERAPRWKTLGFVLAILPNGVRMLKKSGVFDFVKPKAAKIRSFSILDDGGRLLCSLDFQKLKHKHGPTLEVERDILHRALRHKNKGADIRMCMTVISLRQAGKGVMATFSNRKRELFDVVVGADGSDSQVRKLVLPKARKDYSGFTFWMFWVPRTFRLPTGEQYLIGKRRFFGLFQTKSTRRVCVLLAVPAREHSFIAPERTVDFLRDNFKGMGGIVPEVLARLPERPAAIFHHDDDEVHLRRWCNGRVVMIGDAVHALSPMMGTGASMAMEDAYVLAEELGKGDIEGALQRYAARRLARVAFLARTSRILHWLITWRAPFYAVRNLFLKRFYGPLLFMSMDGFLSKKL